MDIGRFYRIISLKDDKNALRRLLENQGGELEIAAKRLLGVMQSAGCKTVVVEFEYVDSDFRDSQKEFYYLHFKDTARRCQRLHFFASKVTDDDLHLMAKTVSATYLGCSVIRPLPSHPLGCTVISELAVLRMFPRLNLGEDRYLACSALHQVNLAGNNISFKGTPWMQQDRLVAACASIAIWIANRHLAQRFPFDFKRCTSAKITRLATQFNAVTGRAMPSDGLRTEQMIRALTSLGYEPLSLQFYSSEDAARICSQYIRSSIPVIAILSYPDSDDGHAVTLVGHTFSDNPIRHVDATNIGNRSVQLYDVSDFVPRFLVQDDSGGPLRSLEFLSWEDALLRGWVTEELKGKFKDTYQVVARLQPPVDASDDIVFLDGFLIPLPLRVTLKASKAHENAKDLVRLLMIEERKIKEKALILDTYLRPSNDYKTWWSTLNGRPVDVAPLLRQHILPRWIWITEVSTFEDSGNGRDVLAHIIQDSSGRGTRQVLDDLIGVIGPDTLALALADGTFSTTPRTNSLPICKFRDGESI